jgi:hypothetical protein
MDREHYCIECGDLRDAPGVCSACVTFELVDLTEREARTAEG